MHSNKGAGLCLALVTAVGLWAACGQVRAQADSGAAQPREYSDRGADTCLRCHDEDSEFPVLAIFKTRHAQPGDARSPFAKLQCETCHGPIGEHGKRKLREGEKRQPIINFRARSGPELEHQNRSCLDCHQRHARSAWPGSAHERAEVGCTSCHRVHVEHDPVLAKSTQPEVCYSCHLRTRAEFARPSVHPVRFGRLACSDCHEPHSALNERLLARHSVNQTCYGCHAEKRGPFLWEHPPVAEDCRSCHLPHGSLHPALLVKRPPLLCQQCHSQLGHPSVPQTPAGLTGGSASGFLLAGSCLNCHSQVHGSNHPSGVKLMR